MFFHKGKSLKRTQESNCRRTAVFDFRSASIARANPIKDPIDQSADRHHRRDKRHN